MMLAQTTQHTEWTPEAIYWLVSGVVLLFCTLLVPSIIALRKSFQAHAKAQTASDKADTNATNIATTAKVVDGTVQAQRQSPGPNVPISATLAVRQIAADPTQPVAAPIDVSPVGPPSAEGINSAIDSAAGKDVT
jgi:hypothetical protein